MGGSWVGGLVVGKVGGVAGAGWVAGRWLDAGCALAGGRSLPTRRTHRRNARGHQRLVGATGTPPSGSAIAIFGVSVATIRRAHNNNPKTKAVPAWGACRQFWKRRCIKAFMVNSPSGFATANRWSEIQRDHLGSNAQKRSELLFEFGCVLQFDHTSPNQGSQSRYHTPETR